MHYLSLYPLAPQLVDLVRKVVDSMSDLNQKQSCLCFVHINAPIAQRHIVFHLGQR